MDEVFHTWLDGTSLKAASRFTAPVEPRTFKRTQLARKTRLVILHVPWSHFPRGLRSRRVSRFCLFVSFSRLSPERLRFFFSPRPPPRSAAIDPSLRKDPPCGRSASCRCFSVGVRSVALPGSCCTAKTDASNEPRSHFSGK